VLFVYLFNTHSQIFLSTALFNPSLFINFSDADWIQYLSGFIWSDLRQAGIRRKCCIQSVLS